MRSQKERLRLLRRISPLGFVAAMRYSFYLYKRVNECSTQSGIDFLEVPEWGGEGFVFSKTRNCPLIVRLHTPHFLLRGIEQVPLSLSSLLIERIEREAIQGADIITSPSLSMAKIVSNCYGIPLDRIHVIRNPIDVNVFQSADRHTVQRENIILYVGRLAKRKGVHTLIEAIPQIIDAHPATKFLFVGPDMMLPNSGGSMKAELLARAATQNISNKVQFLPPQSRKDLIKIYQASNLCVVPSFYDNYPYTCLEAMACGKPVVVSDIGGLSELVEDQRTGVKFPVGDPSALASTIIDVLKNKALMETLGENARNFVEDTLSPIKIAQETLDCYQGVKFS